MAFQLGTALFAAALVKSYASGSPSVETVGWLFISVMLMSIGWLVLGLLEPEK